MLLSPLLGAGAVLAASLAAAPAPGVVVLNVTGSGCHPGTTTAALSPDRTAITVTYSDYLASATATTRNCRINLKVNPIPGYAPTITSVDYRGFADLAPGSVARLAASYGFHGAAHLQTAALGLTGPVSDDWETTDTAAGGLVTGSCKGSDVLDVDSTLSLTSTAATDFVAMDSTDGAVPNTFHVTWRPCS